jgi:hypothetical protein
VTETWSKLDKRTCATMKLAAPQHHQPTCQTLAVLEAAGQELPWHPSLPRVPVRNSWRSLAGEAGASREASIGYVVVATLARVSGCGRLRPCPPVATARTLA